MIEIWSYREKNGPEILLHSRYADTQEAIRSLYKYELGYGGQITDLTDEKIEVVTHILNCKDRTVYTGAKGVMNDLVIAACLWLQADKEVSFDDWWKRIAEASKGNALLVTTSAPLIRGDMVMEKLAQQLQESA